MKEDVVILCGGTTAVAKNEANMDIRDISQFAKSTMNSNVIVTCVPHHFDLQPLPCISKEVESFNRKLQKSMKIYSHVQVCSMSFSRDHFTMHGFHMNTQGKSGLQTLQLCIITSYPPPREE
jgi:hypothetical protein